MVLGGGRRGRSGRLGQGPIDTQELAWRVPDLRGTACRAIDVLAALEWDREIRAWFGERWGDRVTVDCRGLAAEEWSGGDAQSVKRGILAPLPAFEFEPGLEDAAFAALADEFAAHTDLEAPAEYSDVFALERA